MDPLGVVLVDPCREPLEALGVGAIEPAVGPLLERTGTPDRRSASRSRLKLVRARTAYTVERGWPSSGPRRCGPQRRSTLARRIASMTSGQVDRGERRGREVRSASPDQPSSRYRRSHLWAVVRLTPCASAALAAGQPSSSIRDTRSCRPETLRRAVRWATRASSRLGCCAPPTMERSSHSSTTSLGITPSPPSSIRMSTQ